MSYAAIHYVRIGRRVYTPGEIIDTEIPDEKRERLLEKGAIRETGAPFYADVKAPGRESADDASETPNGVDDGEDGPETPNPGEAEASAKDEEDGEVEIEAEAPEIDVTDGIVTEPKKAAETVKPKPAGRRKKA